MRAAASILILLAWAAAAQAAAVKAENGRVVLDGRPITSGHRDSDPVLSPDGRHVVFQRQIPGKLLVDCSATGDGATPVELWMADADGRAPRRLLELHSEKDVKTTVCAFDSVQFSPDGQILYFETPAWATSGAIHVYDFKTGRESFLMAGDSLLVLRTCHFAPYQGDLIVSQHRYFVFSGSYDWSFLFTPDGKEVGPLGDGDFSDDLDDKCEWQVRRNR